MDCISCKGSPPSYAGTMEARERFLEPAAVAPAPTIFLHDLIRPGDSRKIRPLPEEDPTMFARTLLLLSLVMFIPNVSLAPAQPPAQAAPERPAPTIADFAYGHDS